MKAAFSLASKMQSLVLGLFLALPVAGPCQTDTTPTIGSEIKRGMNAVDACNGNVLNAIDFGQCIYGIEERNRQKFPYHDPFDVGLFFGAWLRMDFLAHPTSPPADDSAKKVAAASQDQAGSMLKVFRGLQKKVGVTDEEVIILSGMSPSELRARLAIWNNPPSP